MKKHYGGAVVVPRPIFATKHVLCMEFLRGEKLDKARGREGGRVALVRHESHPISPPSPPSFRPSVRTSTSSLP